MSASTTLIFDLDGTMTDPRDGIARSFIYALERLGLVAPASHELTRYIGPPLREVFSLLLATDDAARIENAVTLYQAEWRAASEERARVNRSASGPSACMRINLTQAFTLRSSSCGRRAIDCLCARAKRKSTLSGSAATFMIGDRMHDMQAAH